MTATPLAHGAAEALAVCAHLEQLTDALGADAGEVSRIYRPLLGLNHADTTEVIEHLRDELDQLWRLLSCDWMDSDLDELPDHPRFDAMTVDQAQIEAASRTAARLTEQIERYVEARRQRPTTGQAAILAVSA
jgi:hypothetical protein